MVADAKKFDALMVSNGSGSFGNLEYDPSGNVVLRTADVKTTDVGGTVRVYFDNQREQIMTGRRFDPMSSGLILFRPGTFYRVQSQIEITKPIPKGVVARIVLRSDIADVMMITSEDMYEGFVGPVFFTVQSYRKVEVEKMTTLASLIFFEDSPDKFFAEDEVPIGVKSGTSNRGKNKNNSSGLMIDNSGKPKEGQNAVVVSDEHSDDPES